MYGLGDKSTSINTLHRQSMHVSTVCLYLQFVLHTTTAVTVTPRVVSAEGRMCVTMLLVPALMVVMDIGQDQTVTVNKTLL